MLEGFIFFVPETVDPRDDNPELADAEFVQQSDVHAVNQTAVEGVKQVLESLFVGLSDLERSGDVLQVEKLELLEDLLRYGQIGVGLVKVTGLLLVLTYLQHLLLAYLLDIHQVVLYLRVVVIKQVMRHLQQPGVYSVNWRVYCWRELAQLYLLELPLLLSISVCLPYSFGSLSYPRTQFSQEAPPEILSYYLSQALARLIHSTLLNSSLLLPGCFSIPLNPI